MKNITVNSFVKMACLPVIAAMLVSSCIDKENTPGDGEESGCRPARYPCPMPEVVDLGLSVKWASCNLGVSSPEEYGDYFAWGETVPYYEPGYAQEEYPVWKDGILNAYWWPDYRFCSNWLSNTVQLTKYNVLSSYGPVDNKTILEPDDDAATVNLGKGWRIPTEPEWIELFQNCTLTIASENGIKGARFTSKKPGYTDNSIFLPASGLRSGIRIYHKDSVNIYYWSSSLDKEYPDKAWHCLVNSESAGIGDMDRFDGLPIRPVKD